MATNLLHEGLAIRVFCALVTKFSGQERETRLAVPFHGLNGSAIEGAIILSRTFHSGNPMLEAGRQLACLIRRCQ